MFCEQKNLENNESLILLQPKGKKFRKRTKMHLPIIWIERASLLQVYFSHFILKQSTIFKDICFKLGTQFCSVCSSSGLIYYGLANWSFRKQIPCANYPIIIICYEVFLFLCFFRIIFFQKLYFFAFWRKKIMRYLVKDVQVMFCKVQLKSVKNIWK